MFIFKLLACKQPTKLILQVAILMTDNPIGKEKFLYVAAFIGNLAAFSSGITVGWPSPVSAKLTNSSRIDENPLGDTISGEQNSWISSIAQLGAACGPIMAGLLTNRIGHKKTLLLGAGVPLLASFLLLAFGKSLSMYYIARFIGGFAFGTVLSVLPNFLSEISKDSVRGMVSSSMTVFLICGTLYAFAVGPYVSIMWFNMACAVWPALFLILFSLFVPESPYYLMACNDLSGATKSLKKFRSTSEWSIIEELEMIKYSVKREANERTGFFTNVLHSKSVMKALIISLSLVGFQQLSGIFVVLFNAQTIFSATGSDIPAEISTIIIGSVQVAVCFLAHLAIDRLGRKFLLIISATGMFIAEVPLGWYFYLHDNEKDVSSITWLPMVCLIVYVIFFNLGFALVPWTVMAEIFPANIKTTASTVTACFNAILSFAVTKSFTSLHSAIGMSGTFWMFSVFCAMAALFVKFYMFETKGRSFQDIQSILSK